MTFIKFIPHQLQQYNRSPLHFDIYWARSLLPEILMILFTQSTAVLHKYLNDKLKILFVTIFPDIAQNSLRFQCSEKSLSIPGFPGLWPPC